MAQSEKRSPGKRKVPGSNPGRSVGHFFRSVISRSSLSFFHVLKLRAYHLGRNFSYGRSLASE